MKLRALPAVDIARKRIAAVRILQTILFAQANFTREANFICEANFIREANFIITFREWEAKMRKRLLTLLLLTLLPLSPALAQGVPASTRPNETYPVYSGPGEHYLRGAEGQALVSTNGGIIACAIEGDWVMICYPLAGHEERFGYITVDALRRRVAYPVADFAYTPGRAVVDCVLTDDHAVSRRALRHLSAGAALTYLMQWNDGWVYVEVDDGQTAPARGFIPADAYRPFLGGEYYGIRAAEGEPVPLYAAPAADAPVLAQYYGGVSFVAEPQADGWAAVYRLQYQNLGITSGYMRMEALQLMQEDAFPRDDRPLGFLANGTWSPVPFYPEPRDTRAPLARCPVGTAVEVNSIRDGWLEVSIAHHSGYVRADQVRIEADTRYTDFLAQAHETATVAFQPDDADVMDGLFIDLYPLPYPGIPREIQLSAGAEVAILAELGDWCQVRHHTQIGFVETRFLVRDH
jgi:hypothetical protein